MQPIPEREEKIESLLHSRGLIFDLDPSGAVFVRRIERPLHTVGCVFSPGGAGLWSATVGHEHVILTGATRERALGALLVALLEASL